MVKFNIIKNDPLDGHKGVNAGSISLENVAPLYIDINTGETFIDLGGLHARADVETRVKWVTDKSIPEGEGAREFYLVWVTVERTKEGPVYQGVASCYQMINKEKKRGYKLMHEHVNALDKSMKGIVDVSEMDAKSKGYLKKFLKNHNADMWENSKALQEALVDAEVVE